MGSRTASSTSSRACLRTRFRYAWTREIRSHQLPDRIEVFDVPVPHDCSDGFLGAYWRRPEAYLEEEVRAAISVFSRIGSLEAGLVRLRADLESGEWQRRYGSLPRRTELDLGYRLVVA